MRINKRTARKLLAEGKVILIRDNKFNHAGTVRPGENIDDVLTQAKDAGWGSKFTFHTEN